MSHGIASSTTVAQTTKRVTTDEDEPPQISMTAASKEKVKTIVDEQCPELSKQKGKWIWVTKDLAGKQWNSNSGGMNLKYIPPVIVDWEKVVKILLEDVVQDDEKWDSINSSIFGGNNSIYWSHGTRDMVLCSGPHHLLRRHVIMKPWVPEINFKEEILTTIPLWVKHPNLPLNCWNSAVLSKIGSSLGNPFYADECTIQTSRISFARILVNVYKWGTHVWTNQLQLYMFRRKGRDKDRGKNRYPPQTRNKALEKSRLRISSRRNRSMRRMKHHRDKENGRLLDIELLSEENLGTVKIQEEDRTLNQGY
ncbi:hypothetical protein KY284_007953 [Solanum tuberosum]|nr:hypothetical protein KY284_007953 [Solanum tuberosum]